MSYLKAMTLPGVRFWKVISWTNSELPLEVTPALFTTALSSSYAGVRVHTGRRVNGGPGRLRSALNVRQEYSQGCVL